jgi:hypothetical protein
LESVVVAVVLVGAELVSVKVGGLVWFPAMKPVVVATGFEAFESDGPGEGTAFGAGVLFSALLVVFTALESAPTGVVLAVVATVTDAVVASFVTGVDVIAAGVVAAASVLVDVVEDVTFESVVAAVISVPTEDSLSALDAGNVGWVKYIGCGG